MSVFMILQVPAPSPPAPRPSPAPSPPPPALTRPPRAVLPQSLGLRWSSGQRPPGRLVVGLLWSRRGRRERGAGLGRAGLGLALVVGGALEL